MNEGREPRAARDDRSTVGATTSMLGPTLELGICGPPPLVRRSTAARPNPPVAGKDGPQHPFWLLEGLR